MSDHPKELELKLNNVVLAVSDVTDWFNLGLQLGLPSATLRLIAADPNIKDIKSQRLAMLSEWLKYDTAASWEKLAAALDAIGENVVAANVRSQFMKVATSSAVADISEDEKTCQEMKENVLQTIKCQFASLQLEVRSAMEAQQVKVCDVHQFLVASFQDVGHVPEAPDLTKIFNIVTESKLWRYDNYIPLKKLAEKFLPDDDPARKHFTKYRSQLSGFYTTTKIIEFIDLSKLEEAEDDAEHPAFVAENYKKHYRRLTLRLKLDRKVKLSDLTLDYVDTLWKALIEEFNLPPLTAVIDEIVGGSLIIHWLVPPQVSTVIAASYSKALSFYQQHNIVQVQLDGRTLYHEEWIAGDINTDLIQACRRGEVERATVLLEYGADVNSENQYGETALFGACRGGHVETARILLDHGAIVDQRNEYGQSPLSSASSVGAKECVKLLLKYGAQVDLPNWYRETALIGACRGGHVEIARVLLDHGAIVDHQNEGGKSALWVASEAGETECVKLLLKYGAQVDLRKDYRETALFGACRGGHVEIARVLLDHGVIVDQQNKHGESALWVASDVGATECVKLLLKYGAQVDLPNVGGNTALIRACQDGHTETARVLLDHRANVDQQDNDGGTGLMWASARGYTEIVSVLLEAKADLNITDEDGDTALHDAANHDRTEVIQHLVKHGALLDIRNKWGETALHRTALWGCVAAVKTLVECGASVDIRNMYGLTALEVARGGGFQAICEILEKYTKQGTEVTEEQRESIYQRLLKMLERTFLKEQVKKREEQQKKEHHHQREERVRGEREKRSLWNRLRGHRDRPGQIIGTAPAPEK